MNDAIRKQILEKAVELTLGDRNKSYGDPKENMEFIAKLFNVWMSNEPSDFYEFDSVDVAMFLLFVKISRIRVSPQHTDSYIDAAAYVAIAAECAGVELTVKKKLDAEDWFEKTKCPELNKTQQCWECGVLYHSSPGYVYCEKCRKNKAEADVRN